MKDETDDMSRMHTSPEPLFNTFADRIGLDRISASIPGSPSPLVCWAGFWVTLTATIQAYKYYNGFTVSYLNNPATILGDLQILLAAVAVGYLYKRCNTVLEQIDFRERTTEPQSFFPIIPTRWQVLIYVVAIAYTFVTFFLLKGVETLTQVGGFAEIIFAAVVAPVGYATVTAEFVGIYIGIMFLLPRRIKQKDFKLHFLDPEGLGGLRPVGELMKTTYYFIILGLIIWLFIVYGPFIMGQFLETPFSRPGFIINSAFTGAWLLSIATMAYGLSQLHLYMKSEKRKELTRLDRQAREHTENPFDLQAYNVTNEDKFEDLRTRMEYVNATNEYPTTFTMWSQILISLILPKAIQMILSSI